MHPLIPVVQLERVERIAGRDQPIQQEELVRRQEEQVFQADFMAVEEQHQFYVAYLL